MKNIKNKKGRKISEVVSSVLNPLRGNKFKNKKDAFVYFLYHSTEQEFNGALDVLLRDEEIFSYLNQSKMPSNELVRNRLSLNHDFMKSKLLKLFESILLRESDKITRIIKLKENLEDLFVKNEFECLNEHLQEINSLCGSSIWELNFRALILKAMDETEKIDSLLSNSKIEDNDILHEFIRVNGWKILGLDASFTVNTVRKNIKEFIEGGALDLAAFFSLMLLPYPIYDDVHLSNSICYLNELPLIDLLDALQKIIIYSSINDDLQDDVGVELIGMFKSLNYKLGSNSLSRFFSTTNERKNNNIDIDVYYYMQGKYSLIVEHVENNIYTVKNIISKVNIIAKSYIYTNRTPNNLPSLLHSIIKNLIAIYSLNEANQAIAQLIDIAMTYSCLEISEHILISVVKAAPYYFDEKIGLKIKKKSKFFQTPLTSLAYKLKYTKSLYFNYESNAINKSIKQKYIIINALENGCEYVDDLINEYEKVSLIRKEFIDLKVRYFLKNNYIIELIEYCSDELIKNSNSNVCLPLEKVMGFIFELKLYSLNSVICAYYHGLYSQQAKPDVINEFFEEYMILINIERPSDLVTKQMSHKEIFLLYEISKIDIMDFLGSFEDENDLKIERIKILDKLVSLGYKQQSEIDKEYKSIVDSILIDNEVAKFNYAKVFVDAEFIYEKRKDDIEGFIQKYHYGDALNFNDIDIKYGAKNLTLLKGNKNIVVIKMVSMLLQEFIGNKEVGLDINLSSQIRHGFFSNLLCSSLQRRHLITELDVNSVYKNNTYWTNYYEIINDYVLNDLNNVLVKFSENFNSLIDMAECWMKTSIEDSSHDKVFIFDISVEDIEIVKENLDLKKGSYEIAELIFTMFNNKLTTCLDNLKTKLNVEFLTKLDDLFQGLIESINYVKRDSSMSDLLDEIKLSNTELKEHVHTVCKWFSLRKKNELDSIELEKLIRLAVKCFNQINNCEIDVDIEKNEDFFVSGEHLYVLVLSFINFLNNASKFSVENFEVKIKIISTSQKRFKISVSNKMSTAALSSLQNGRFESICEKLINMNDEDLLLNNGGSGLYKCLHALKNISKEYNLKPSYLNDIFEVEITYGY